MLEMDIYYLREAKEILKNNSKNMPVREIQKSRIESRGENTHTHKTPTKTTTKKHHWRLQSKAEHM